MKKLISLLTIASLMFSSFVVVGTNTARAAASDLAITAPANASTSPGLARDVSFSWTIGLQTGQTTIATSSIAQFKVKTNAGALIAGSVSACAASTTAIAGGGVTQAYGVGIATFTFATTTANTSGTACIKVPALAEGIYYITLYTGSPANDSAAVALYVGGFNQVTVTADVDPTFSFTLSSNSCDLGILQTSATSTCTYHATSTANTVQTGGIAVMVRADNAALRAGAETIDAIVGAPGSFAVATEANGVRLSANAGGNIGGGFNGTANQGQALPTSPTAIYTSSGANTTVSFTAMHIAIAGAATKVGHYTQQVTYSATLGF